MPKRILTGKVVSNKMAKTASVSVESRRLHPLYKKTIKKTKKYKIHDEENTCSIGDIVRIMECRPLSKDKSWKLVNIVQKVQT